MIAKHLSLRAQATYGNFAACIACWVVSTCMATAAFAGQSLIPCGTVILGDTVLKNDIGPCAGDGLVIGASGITVNLNGHRIVGTQRANVGVRLSGVSNVTVKGGVVEGFDAGVLLSGGQSNLVTVMTVRNNRFGIQVENAESSRHTIDNNRVTGNRLIGVFLRQSISEAAIRRNQVNANTGFGIVVDGGSGGNLIEANEAVGNGELDIVLRRETVDPIVTSVSPPVFGTITAGQLALVEGTDYRVMAGSSGPRKSAQARLVPIDISLAASASAISNPDAADTSTSGCEEGDYAVAGFQPGDIALIQRGTCTLDKKLLVASFRGAAAVLIFNEGQAPDRQSPEFGYVASPFSNFIGAPIPVLSLSYAQGFALVQSARAGPVVARVETEAELTFGAGGLPPTHHNLVTKNTALSVADENFICSSNLWTKNSFSVFIIPCGEPGGGGFGVTTNAY
jgi:parallel beta-helix repeat protein